MKCFFHSADQDGLCSGAIVKYKYPGCDMYPIDYGDPFPWEEIKHDETVFIVDFTLEPFVDMLKLNKMCKLIWIDHHKSHISEEKKYFKKGDIRIEGIREDGRAACELTWGHLIFPDPLPESVHLLGRYDVWDHSNPDTLPFQYGLRLWNTDPTNQELWTEVFSSKRFRDVVLEQGRAVLKYVEQENTKYADYAFETTLDGFRCIAINKLLTNSKLFDSVWDPEKYDIMIAFGFARDKWRVSFYTTKDDIDVSVIAVAHNGGGHKQAGGFTCLELPFELSKESEIPLFMVGDEVFNSDKNYGVVTKIEKDDETEAENYRYLVSFPDGDSSFYWGFQLEGK